MRYVPASVAALCLLLPSAAFAQPAPREATDILKADIDRVLATMGKGGDSQLLVAALRKGQIGVGIVHWLPGTRGALSHSQVDEVYYMLEGTGTLLTGGTIADGKPLATTSEVVTVLVGPSMSGTKVAAGTSRKISAGDIVVIPAGVPHQWVTVDTKMRYIDIRIDPDSVLRPGYVHPEIRK